MKSTKCSVLNTHTTQKTQDFKTHPPSRSRAEDLHVDALDQDATEPSASRQVRCGRCLKAHIHSSQGGGRTYDSWTRTCEVARRSRCIRRRAQGCKIHGCRSRLSPLVSQVLIRYPIELYKAQNFQNRTYSKPHTRLTRVEKDHVLGPAEKDTTRPTIVYRGRRPWHLLPNCANQYGMA